VTLSRVGRKLCRNTGCVKGHYPTVPTPKPRPSDDGRMMWPSTWSTAHPNQIDVEAQTSLGDASGHRFSGDAQRGRLPSADV